MKRLSLLVVSLALFVSVPANAQDPGEEDARHHFRIGQAHYESAHFLEAAEEFERSYELSHRPQLLHNIYVAYRDANELDRARDYLRRYLEAVPDAPHAAVLRGRLAALEGSTDEPPDDDPPPDDGAAASSSSSTRSNTSGGSGGALSPIGFIVGGVGAALMIGGAVTGGLAISNSDELADNCPMMRCPPGYDHEGVSSTGSALAVTTDILIPLGGAALVTGIILIFVLEGGGSDDVATTCGPAGCSVGVRF